MADDSQEIADQEIEDLLNQAKGALADLSGQPSTAGPQTENDDPGPNEAATPGEGEGHVTGVASRSDDPATLLFGQAPPTVSTTPTVNREPTSTSDDIQYLLQQAEEAIASADAPVQHELETFQFRDFSAEEPSPEKATLDLLRDVELDLRIELGRTEMYLEDVLKLRRGAVVALDKIAGEPVDVFANGRLVARGEVLVMNDNFCVRVAELIAGDETD